MFFAGIELFFGFVVGALLLWMLIVGAAIMWRLLCFTVKLPFVLLSSLLREIEYLAERAAGTVGPRELWGKWIGPPQTPEPSVRPPLKQAVTEIVPGYEVAAEATLLARSLGYTDHEVEEALALDSARCLQFLRKRSGHTST